MLNSGIRALTKRINEWPGFTPYALLSSALAIMALTASHGDALAVGGGSITNGQSVTGSVVSGQIDTWTFTANKGDSIWATVSETGANTAFVPRIDVIGPGGNVGEAVYGAYESGDLAAKAFVVAPVAATYTIQVQQDTATTVVGNYVLTLAQSPGAFVVTAGHQGGPIANGATVTGSLLRGDVDMWSFSANKGDSIWAAASETGTNTGFLPRVDVYGPDGVNDGENVYGAYVYGDLAAKAFVVAPLTGSYTIVVQRAEEPLTDGVGTYALTLAQSPGAFVVTAGHQGGPIANGATVTGSLLRGDVDMWSFSANKGDSIWAAASETGTNTGFLPRVDVYGPDGVNDGENVYGAYVYGDLAAKAFVVAPLTGSYTIVVQRAEEPLTDGVGTYALTLAQSPGAFVVTAGHQGGPIANGATVTGSLLRGDVDMWSFSANKGDSIWAAASETGTNTGFLPRVDVYGPDGVNDGENVYGAYVYGDLAAKAFVVAPLTGSYTIVVQRGEEPLTDGVGTYALTLAQSPGAFVVTAGHQGGPIANGATVTGSLLRGDVDMWSFSANKGDSIWAAASETGTNTGFLPRVDVYGPDGVNDGENVYGAYVYGDLAAKAFVVAPLTGSYTIVVQRAEEPLTDGVGTYALTLAQSPGAFVVTAGHQGGPIANGATVTGSLLRGDVDMWSFTATTGNQLQVTASETATNPAFAPRVDVYGPDGVGQVHDAVHGLASEVFVAPLTGSYTIVVQHGEVPVSDGVDTYSLTMTGAVASGGTGPVVNLAAPIRIIDTRTLGSGPIAAGASRCFTAAGVGGIPSDASAVVLNVTAVGYGTNGWLTVYPNGQAVPATSTLNFDVHEYAMANGAIMRIGSSGQVCVNVGTVNSVPGSAQVILDATGYLTADDLLLLPMLTSPQRVADTRTGGGQVATGSSQCFTVVGVQGVPADAAAVVVNVTAVGYGQRGWLTAYPSGQSVPATSTVNFDTTEYAIANGTIVRVGPDGKVCVNVGTVGSAPGSTNIVLDVTGYLTTNGLAQMPMLASPQRVIDTRTSGGPAAAGQSRCFNIAGLVGVPSTASAVVLNVTAVGYGQQGWLTAYPAGQALPATSTLNFDTTEYAMANGAVMAIGTGGQVCVNVGTVGGVSGNSQIIIDVVGFM